MHNRTSWPTADHYKRIDTRELWQAGMLRISMPQQEQVINATAFARRSFACWTQLPSLLFIRFSHYFLSFPLILSLDDGGLADWTAGTMKEQTGKGRSAKGIQEPSAPVRPQRSVDTEPRRHEEGDR